MFTLCFHVETQTSWSFLMSPNSVQQGDAAGQAGRSQKMLSPLPSHPSVVFKDKIVQEFVLRTGGGLVLLGGHWGAGLQDVFGLFQGQPT